MTNSQIPDVPDGLFLQPDKELGNASPKTVVCAIAAGSAKLKAIRKRNTAVKRLKLKWGSHTGAKVGRDRWPVREDSNPNEDLTGGIKLFMDIQEIEI